MLTFRVRFVRARHDCNKRTKPCGGQVNRFNANTVRWIMAVSATPFLPNARTSIWYGEAAFWCAHLRCTWRLAHVSRVRERTAYCACAGLQLIPIHYHTSFKSSSLILFCANNALIIKYFTNTNIALILCARDIICPVIYRERGESLWRVLSLAYTPHSLENISRFTRISGRVARMKPSHGALNFTRWNESTQKWLSHLVISAPI